MSTKSVNTCSEDELVWIDEIIDRVHVHKQIHLDKSQPQQVLRATHIAHDMSGFSKADHKMMYSVFTNLGYCKDGKTTIAAAQKEAEEQAKILLNQVDTTKDAALQKIDEQIAQLKEQQKAIKALDLTQIKDKAQQTVLETSTKLATQTIIDQTASLLKEAQRITNQKVEPKTIDIKLLSKKELRGLAIKHSIPKYWDLNKGDLQLELIKLGL